MSVKELLKRFLDGEGRLTAWPAKRRMKVYALFYLAEKFDADVEYSERDVNRLLADWHTFSDPATLRRELCDYGFLIRSRDCSRYVLAAEQPTPEGLGFPLG